jgi:hypothetical protein
MTTTDTPRTDAIIQSPNSYFMVRVENLCRELERELAASQAEVERLLHTLKFLRDECPLGKRTFARVSNAINEHYKL